MPPIPRTDARKSTGPGCPGSPVAQDVSQDAETALRADVVVHTPCNGPLLAPICGVGGHHGAPARGYMPAYVAPLRLRPLHTGVQKFFA